MKYKGKKIAILGYGLEGQDADKFMRGQGAKVTLLDRKFDENYLNNLRSYDTIVRSPGVYRYLPELVKAQKAGVEITSAIKIFFDLCPGRIIGVTGTKGKGTTSTLIYEMLKKAGFDVYLAGNIGKPMLELLPFISGKTYVVLEMSSFQLIDINKSPGISVVLNITSDHMDWHKDQKEYLDAKKNIISHQSPHDSAIINSEYQIPKTFSKLTRAKVIFFSKKSMGKKYSKNLLLRGEHNLENIAAAVAVAKLLKINDAKILSVLQNFKGLEHRLELVGTFGGVRYYNDSFATGPQPTIAAIKSFKEPTTLILGGSDKGLDYKELGVVIGCAKNIKNIVLIGQVRNVINKSINGKIPGLKVYDLEFAEMGEIVKKAKEITPKGGVVLLSPAAASFDMFANYKDRGNQFKEAVKNLNS